MDPYSGASGDMIIGCLLDLGADAKVVYDAVESVGCRLEISRERRGHIMASRAKILSNDRFQDLSAASAILQDSSLKGKALENALKAMDILATAESKVHGEPKEETKFHEIGALDALADIAGGCAALESLGVKKVFSLPVSVGGGFSQSAHGLLPVPGPATLEIMRTYNIPWKGGPIVEELLTPTGATMLAVIVEEFLNDSPLIIVKQVGYGAGGRDLPLPNSLRGLIGEVSHEYSADSIVQLETNVDDVTGEVLANLIDLLMDAGALDVSVVSALMKKGRSGNIIRVIARRDETEKMSRIIMRETGTLGVRVFPSLHRYVAERESMYLEVEINGFLRKAAVKVSRLEGALLNIKPEYEDCKRIADDTGLPLRIIMKKVEDEGWRALST